MTSSLSQPGSKLEIWFITPHTGRLQDHGSSGSCSTCGLGYFCLTVWLYGCQPTLSDYSLAATSSFSQQRSWAAWDPALQRRCSRLVGDVKHHPSLTLDF